jgi:hypothetical protein
MKPEDIDALMDFDDLLAAAPEADIDELSPERVRRLRLLIKKILSAEADLMFQRLMKHGDDDLA